MPTGDLNYKNITVAGSGVLRSRLLFKQRTKGFHVNVYDISDQVLSQAKERLTKLKDNYKEDLRATQQTVNEAFSRISFYADLAQAVADADLVIETIPEGPTLKLISIPNSGKLPRRKRSLQQTHPLCCRVTCSQSARKRFVHRYSTASLPRHLPVLRHSI